MTKRVKLLKILFFLTWSGVSYAQERVVNARPGEIYKITKTSELRLEVKGSGTKESPFIIDGQGNILFGNSYLKIDKKAKNIIIKNVVFKNNKINYRSSKALIQIGEGLNSEVDNVLIDNVGFFYDVPTFKDLEKNTQYFWIIVSGNNVEIKNSVFEGKRNRLPIIHVDADFENTIIEKNVFKNVPSRKGDALEAIRIGQIKGPSNAIVRNNVFENYHGDPETISIKADNPVVENNRFINSRSGVCIRYANGVVVQDNDFINVKHPIRIAGKNHKISGNSFQSTLNNISIILMLGGEKYPQVDNILIANNNFSTPPELNFIRYPGNDILPTKVRYVDNLVKGQKQNHQKLSDFFDVSKNDLEKPWKELHGLKYYSINIR